MEEKLNSKFLFQNTVGGDNQEIANIDCLLMESVRIFPKLQISLGETQIAIKGYYLFSIKLLWFCFNFAIEKVYESY